MISIRIKSRKDLFMAKDNTKSKKGFTIIEVVLVLAIAGLIFLMVFVALPALQRSQRDTQRRNDISRVDTSLVQYQTNNQGTNGGSNLPVDGEFKSNVHFYADNTEDPQCEESACKFVRNYMNSGTSDSVAENVFQDPDGTYYGMEISGFTNKSDSFEYTDTAMDHIIYIVRGAKCDGERAIPADSQNITGSRHFAVIYRLEGAGTYCIDDQ